MTVKQPKSEAFFAGRLTKPMSELLLQWNETPRLAWETKSIANILRVDKAHLVMLAEQGITPEAESGALLHEIEKLARPGGIQLERGYGSMVLQIERTLAAQLGENVAGRLPIARSRLDQGATVKRICDRDNVLGVMEALLQTHGALMSTADKYRDVAFMGYTHLQQAQPCTFGHWIFAYKSRLDDCVQQLQQVYDRIDRSPLGAVGLSGTDISIDRERTAALLGFSQGVLQNSRLGYDAYHQVEIAFVLAMIMTILNDLCSDLHIFSSIEFGTVDLDDQHCSTSSVFPQKKNPYALETVKKHAGISHGWVASALATVRNEGSVDTAARTVSCLSEAYSTTVGMLQLTAEIVQNLTVKEDRCEELLSKAWVTTNRLGNILLLEHGFDYRTAHGIVARLVCNCLSKGISKAEVTVRLLQDAAAEMGCIQAIETSDRDLVSALDHTEFIQKSTSLGSVGPQQVASLQKEGLKRHAVHQAWLDEKRRFLEAADVMLDRAAKRLVRLYHGN